MIVFLYPGLNLLRVPSFYEGWSFYTGALSKPKAKIYPLYDSAYSFLQQSDSF